jgi:hypothetical protein
MSTQWEDRCNCTACSDILRNYFEIEFPSAAVRFPHDAEYTFRPEITVMFVVQGAKVVGLLSLCFNVLVRCEEQFVCSSVSFLFVCTPMLNRELYCSA